MEESYGISLKRLKVTEFITKPTSAEVWLVNRAPFTNYKTYMCSLISKESTISREFLAKYQSGTHNLPWQEHMQHNLHKRKLH